MRSQLRDLSDKIRHLANEHATLSQAGSIVSNCCDQLDMLAGIEEGHQREAELEKQLKLLRKTKKKRNR